MRIKKKGPEPFFFVASVADGAAFAVFAAGAGVDDGETTPRVGTSGIAIDAAAPALRAALFFIPLLADFFATFFAGRFAARDVDFLATDFFALFFAGDFLATFLAAFFTDFFGLRVAATEMTPRYDPLVRVLKLWSKLRESYPHLRGDLAKRAPAMADLILLGCGDFSESGGGIDGSEDRVVTESTLTPRRIDNHTL